jgi:hypothetical protein
MTCARTVANRKPKKADGRDHKLFDFARAHVCRSSRIGDRTRSGRFRSRHRHSVGGRTAIGPPPLGSPDAKQRPVMDRLRRWNASSRGSDTPFGAHTVPKPQLSCEGLLVRIFPSWRVFVRCATCAAGCPTLQHLDRDLSCAVTVRNSDISTGSTGSLSCGLKAQYIKAICRAGWNTSCLDDVVQSDGPCHSSINLDGERQNMGSDGRL